LGSSNACSCGEALNFGESFDGPQEACGFGVDLSPVFYFGVS